MEYIEHPDITECNRNGELSGNRRRHKRLMAFVSGFNFDDDEEEEEENEDD